MSFTLGIVGIGQFGSQFAELFAAHPDIEAVYAVDSVPDRIAALEPQGIGFAGRVGTFAAPLVSDVAAIAVLTQRGTHGEHALAALRAGKHVYSAVPMAIEEEEIRQITEEVQRTGLVYMMGETSQYNSAVVLARRLHRQGV